MAKYVYPTIFSLEDNGAYSIHFPDLPHCYTCGDNIADGIEAAEDVLALTLYGLESENKVIPEPSASDTLSNQLEPQSFITMIKADTSEYRKRFGGKAVKKTLTIPEWINDAAIKDRINFSQVLQEALIDKLNLS